MISLGRQIRDNPHAKKWHAKCSNCRLSACFSLGVSPRPHLAVTGKERQTGTHVAATGFYAAATVRKLQ
jgi:hypothetical protein